MPENQKLNMKQSKFYTNMLIEEQRLTVRVILNLLQPPYYTSFLPTGLRHKITSGAKRKRLFSTPEEDNSLSEYAGKSVHLSNDKRSACRQGDFLTIKYFGDQNRELMMVDNELKACAGAGKFGLLEKTGRVGSPNISSEITSVKSAMTSFIRTKKLSLDSPP